MVSESFLESEAALEEMFQRWKDGSLPGPAFNHGAHLAVCAYLAFEFRGEELALAMKRELIRFNAAVGTPDDPDRGYHETLTRFWCALVEDAISGQTTKLEAARNAVQIYGDDRNAASRYYDFDVLKSREARRVWIPPNLKRLPAGRIYS